MANYANLLATIAANIYTNNKNEVTAAGVKSAVDAMVASLGAGYQFMGVAHIADTPSGYADLRAFWLAGEAGTYTNFGGLVLADGEVAVLKYNGSWSKEVTGAATAAQVAALGQEIGTDTPETIIYNQDSEILHWHWDGSKYVYNADWGLFLIPLESGRTYNISNSSISGYNNKKFFSSLPEVGVAITPTTDPGTEFTGGGNLKYLCVNFIWSTYESGSDKDYEILASAYGIKEDIRNLKTTSIAQGEEISQLDGKIGQIEAEIGADEDTTISHSAEDGYESWYWDGSKYVNNANWMTFLFPLIDGATYDLTGASSVSGYNAKRFFSIKPEVNVEISPISVTGDVFVAGGKSGIKWLAVSLIKSSYDKGSNKYYTFVCRSYGIEADIKNLENSFTSLSHITSLIQAYPYFAGGVVPVITRSRSEYTITIPTNAFWLFGANGSTIFQKSITEPQTFTISVKKKLVYNRSTTNYEVVNNNSSGDYVILAYNNGGLLEGVFSIYGIKNEFESNSIRTLYYRDKEINEALIQGKYKGGINLLLFSDIHGDGVRLDRIMEFFRLFYGSFSDILHCGDTVTREFSDGVAFWDAVSESSRILNVIGNHDTAAIVNDSYDWKAVGNVDVYNRFLANVAQWGVTQPSDASTYGRSYYYKDYGYASNQIRMIVVNCMVMGSDASNYDVNQITWFESVLADAKTNSLPVLIVSHCAPKSVPIDCQFTSNYFDGNGQFGGSYGGEDAFVSAVKDFIDAGGTFISWLCGDTHKDYIGHIADHTEQPVIIIGSSLCSSTTSNLMTRVAGTQTEDLFNILSVHPNRKTIKIKRIGSAIDIDYKSHDILSFNYETREVITSM